MTTLARSVTGGVDTHLDVHVAAALDEHGRLLGIESFATTAAATGGSAGVAAGLRARRPGRRRGHRSLRRGAHPAPAQRADRRRRGRPPEPPTPPAQGQVRSRRRHLGGPRRALGDAAGVGQDPRRRRRVHAGTAGCAVLGAQAPGPRRSTRCAAWSRPHPTSCATSCGRSTSTDLLERTSSYRPGRSATSSRSPSSRCGRWPAARST